MPVSVRTDHLRKGFASPEDAARTIDAVRGATLDIAPGELVTLLGPSGCGKTTLLRLIAGFEEPTSGDIFFGNRRMNDVPPNKRGATMVFQSYAIFPHLDVTENVAFGLRLAKLPRAAVEERVAAALAQAGLTPMARRAPSQLSGGQQQRVALARALVMEPAVLLFDEPLSNLDAKLRDQMRIEIRDLQKRAGITALYVTHDQIEAMSISDRIVVMNGGAIEQIGTPSEIYARPATRFVADFVGKANFLPAQVVGDLVMIGEHAIAGVEHEPTLEGQLTAMIRPEAVEVISPQADASAYRQVFPAQLRRVVFMGSTAECLLDVPGMGELTVDVPNPAARLAEAVGDAVQIGFAPDAVRLLKR